MGKSPTTNTPRANITIALRVQDRFEPKLGITFAFKCSQRTHGSRRITLHKEFR